MRCRRGCELLGATTERKTSDADPNRRVLSVIPNTATGLRDRAIILTLTGRRRSEVPNLKADDISQAGGLFYTYRGKGGKQGKRELPRPAFGAIQAALAAFGKDLATMSPDESLWLSSTNAGPGLTSGTFCCNLRQYLKKAALPPTGVHILRHSAAKLRRDVGETVEDVSRLLDHSSLAVTTVYLRRLEGQEIRGSGKVPEAIGVGRADP